MVTSPPQNPLYERYASREMAQLFSSRHRYGVWRELWIALADCQRQLGLPITEEQISRLREVAPDLDFDRVAGIERETRHDVVAHLRHFAEQAGEAGSILHLGATSAFITDNTDLMLMRDALDLLRQRTATVIGELATFARDTRAIPTLAFTHLQPAQLTTVGKRACIWLQDFLLDLESQGRFLEVMRARGVKGTTGTQASYLTLFDGDDAKVRELDRLFARRIGFTGSFAVTGQTYARKQDSQILALLAGIAESCHKLGTDLRLLQGMGEISEPFGAHQVGSSAMAYKRNPIRAERMCALSRRLITDAMNGPLNAATQWLERSLDDSANRRLVLPDSFLLADAILGLAAGIVHGLTVNESRIRFHVGRELPFMATESLLMKATLAGGDRQHLHEIIRQHSMTAHEAVSRGDENPLIELLKQDSEFTLDERVIEEVLDPQQFIGRSTQQVLDFLEEIVSPALTDIPVTPVEEPRV
jgi:adenylosuccinate lyase